MRNSNFVCFQRYSVDLNSRADEANIPLSTMEATAEARTQNGQSDTNPTNTSGLSEDPRVSPDLTRSLLSRFEDFWKCRRFHQRSTSG